MRNHREIFWESEAHAFQRLATDGEIEQAHASHMRRIEAGEISHVVVDGAKRGISEANLKRLGVEIGAAVGASAYLLAVC